MLRVACIAVFLTVLLSGEIRAAKPQAAPTADIPTVDIDSQQASSRAASTPAKRTAKSKSSSVAPLTPLQQESRLAILREVDGEFARSLTSLPGSKKGFRIKAGEPVDQNALRQAIKSSGASVNPGDGVQITRLDFLSQGILIDLNGGGTVKTSWKDRVQVQMTVSMSSPVSSTGTSSDNRAGVAAKQHGATFVLDFGRPLPEMTAEQVKTYLGMVLDFSKQRSAAVQWVDTLPPAVQQAIQEKHAIAGMDHEQVLVAMGRPDRKVREHDEKGNEIEDWIYGQPPSPTTFVRFNGDKVTRINQYP